MNISGMAGFSRRELRTIALLANGATTRDLMWALGIKRPVAHNYIHFVFRKTGLSTRAEVVAWARENGLDDPSMIQPGKPYVKRLNMRGFFGLGESHPLTTQNDTGILSRERVGALNADVRVCSSPSCIEGDQ